MKGYWTSTGFMGWLQNLKRYILFVNDMEYYEIYKEINEDD